VEKEFVRWLVENHRATEAPVVLGIGDDAAVLAPSSLYFGQEMIIATDAISDQIHFDSNIHSLERIGRKALAVNLSDIAAMGCRPVAALLSIVAPSDWKSDSARRLFSGFSRLAKHYHVAVVGGDTNSWGGRLVVGATIIGDSLAGAKRPFWPLDGASAGDVILVSGSFGGSILGKHLDFDPKLELAAFLAQNYHVNAATDVSDSLSLNLAALASASGCGCEVMVDKIPVSDAAVRLSHDDRQRQTALEHALYDGEDFELILAVPRAVADAIATDPKLPEPVTEIGVLTDSRSIVAVDADGVRRNLTIRGYEH
jgi:thiamine-monophosphate kinase